MRAIFNVSLSVRDPSHKAVSSNHNLSEQKGELMWNQTEALLLTSLSPYRWATPAHYSPSSRKWMFYGGLKLSTKRLEWIAPAAQILWQGKG